MKENQSDNSNLSKLIQNQEAILMNIIRNCGPQSFVNNVSISETENPIKHFKLSDGTHVYSIKASTPSLLISPSELSNITYTQNHWIKTLLPNSDYSETSGAYIHVKPGERKKASPVNMSYTLYDKGEILCNCGYANDENLNTSLFFKLGHSGKSEPYTVGAETTILGIISKELNNSKDLSSSDRIKIENMIEQIANIEKRSLDRYIQKENTIPMQELKDEPSQINDSIELPAPNIEEINVSSTNSVDPKRVPPKVSKASINSSVTQSSEKEEINVTNPSTPSLALEPTNTTLFNKIKSWFKNLFGKKAEQNSTNELKLPNNDLRTKYNSDVVPTVTINSNETVKDNPDIEK